MKGGYFLFFVVLFFNGCSFKAKNVLMVPRLEEPGIIKLYFDREGYLYPPEAHVTPHYFYLLHQKGATKNQNNPAFATIEYTTTIQSSRAGYQRSVFCSFTKYP
jgi:hypothetical protein